MITGKRLGQEIEGPLLHRFDGGLDRTVAGHDDDRRVGGDRLQPAQKLQAVQAGHADVGDDQIVEAVAKGGQRRIAIGHRRDVVTGLAELVFVNPAKALLVIGEQDPDGGLTHRPAPFAA